MAQRSRESFVSSALLVAVVISALVSACNSDRKRPEPPSRGTVVVGLLGDPKTLNPLAATSIESRNIIDLMFLKLLEEQDNFVDFKPKLAQRWEFSPDSLAITFVLREGVTWSDGAPVTADDVRFTWELQVDTLVAWPSRNLKNRILDVEAVDARTVRFRFSKRYPYQLMDANDGVILPKHILADIPRSAISESEFGRRPVGNGPFELARWESGQFVELVRNPRFYEAKLPRLERVVFRIVPEMTTLVTQLVSGEIDCLESLPVEAVSEIDSKHNEIRIYTYMSRHQVFVAWNLGKPLFRSREMRRALAMAVDTQELIETLWEGMAQPSDSPMHPILWAHDPGMEPVPFDTARARAVLAENGWVDVDGDGVVEKGGKEFEFDMIANQGNQLRLDVITMIQAYLRRVGVRVNVRTLEWNTFVQRITSGDFDSCVLGWKTGTRADLTDLWRSTSVPPGGFNISRYRNAAVDSLIDLASEAPDWHSARPLWYKCQRLIFEDQPVLFLAVPYEVVGLRRQYCNVRPNAIGFFVNLPEWYIGESCP